MKPSIGRTVIVRAAIAQSNGAQVAPAVITRVHDADDTGGLVNTTAFPDCAPPVAVTSIHVYPSQEAADRAVGPGGYAAWWPERV